MMASPSDLLAQFELIAADHPNFDVTEDRVALWATALADLPIDLVRRAVGLHLGQNKWEPKLADIRRNCAQLAGAMPPGLDEAVEQVRGGGPYHPAVVRAHLAVGDGQAWASARDPEGMLREFRITYRQMRDSMAEDACETDMILAALERTREAASIEAAPAPALSPSPAPAPPSTYWDTQEGQEAAQANRGRVAAIWKDALGSKRTWDGWRKELRRRDEIGGQAWREELVDIAEVLADDVAPGSLAKFDPGQYRSPHRHSRFLLMRSWTELPDRNSTGVSYASQPQSAVTIENAYYRGVAWLRSIADDESYIDPLVEIVEQRMEPHTGKYVRSDDEQELIPEGRTTTVARFGPLEAVQLQREMSF